jgi:hypothetical protein
MMSYDPHSEDSMFSKILTRLDTLNAKLDRIEEQTIKTNGRVTGIERWRDVITAKVAVVSAAVSFVMGGIAWAFDRFL